MIRHIYRQLQSYLFDIIGDKNEILHLPMCKFDPPAIDTVTNMSEHFPRLSHLAADHVCMLSENNLKVNNTD